MFEKGTVYKRRDLHEKYGGQMQGGISTPADHSIIMLFTSDTGGEYGYTDRWVPGGIFYYTGEGQKGNQEFVRGNRAIRDHMEVDNDLHVFEYVGRGHVEYVGQFTYIGHHFEQAPDITGRQRRVIVFELKPIE